MKYVIYADDWGKTEVNKVQAIIRKVQKMYPQATEEEILWGFVHMTVAGLPDVYFESYLPGFAKARNWTRREERAKQ